MSLPANDRERWAHPNRLGSTIVISDSAGAVVDTHTYSPFGQSGEGDGGFPFSGLIASAIGPLHGPEAG